MPSIPRPSVSKWLIPALLDWAAIVGCFFVAHWCLFKSPSWLLSLPILFVTLIVLAGRQNALGLLGHDGAHKLVSRNRWVNESLTNLLCFWPMGSNLGGYRKFHFDHHRFTGTDKDPEHVHVQNQTKVLGFKCWGHWDVPIERWKFFALLASDFIGGAIPHMLMAMYLTRPQRWVDKIGPLVTTGVIVGACAYFGALWIVGFWFLSIWTAFWAMFRLRIWTEHVNTDGTHLIKANVLERLSFLPHNTEYHFEHHKHPAVPFWALPKFRKNTEDAITVAELFRRHFAASGKPASVVAPSTPMSARAMNR